MPRGPNTASGRNLKIREGAQDISIPSGQVRHERGDRRITQSSPNSEPGIESSSHGANHDSDVLQHKLPAYLHGKNPYGRILEQTERPYKEPTQASTTPPSQLGSSIEGRPRTSGYFNFKTRPAPLPTLESARLETPGSPPFLSKQPAKPGAVQVTKGFFESKARTPPVKLPQPPQKQVKSGTVLTGKSYFESKFKESQQGVSSPPNKVPHYKADDKTHGAGASAVDSNLGSQVTPKTPAADISFDGASAQHSYNPDGRAPVPTVFPVCNASLEDGYYAIQVPDQVNRGGYRRNKTQDPDHPQPSSTLKTYRAPLSDPEKWVKRSCNHFSSIRIMESREEAAKKPCWQCSSSKATTPLLPTTILDSKPPHHAPPSLKRKPKTSPLSATHALDQPKHERAPKATRRRSQSDDHHQGTSSTTQSTTAEFMQDLSHMLDAIIQEHQIILEKVINDMDNSRRMQRQQQRQRYSRQQRPISSAAPFQEA